MGHALTLARIGGVSAPPGGGGGTPDPGRWTDSATWGGGSPPAAGSPLYVGPGETVTVDTYTNAIGHITIADTGVLRHSRNVSSHLRFASMTIEPGGTYDQGSPEAPIPRNVTAQWTMHGDEAGRAPRFVADKVGQTGAGNGRLARLFSRAGAVAQTIVVTFTGPADFNVVGSVQGAIGSGTVGNVFDNKLRFIATAGTAPWVNGDTITVEVERLGFTNDGVGRQIVRMPGSNMTMVGTPPSVVFTHLNDHAVVDDNVFRLADAVDGPRPWAVGDKFAIGPSDYYGLQGGEWQEFTVAAIDGHFVTTVERIRQPRWGKLQYAAPTGIGLSLMPAIFTEANSVAIAAANKMPVSVFVAAINAMITDGLPTVLDERAPVLHMTRNVKGQGANDTAWQQRGFGAAIMPHGRTARFILHAAEFLRMAQAGANGRYPIHFHAPSYNMPDGMNLPSDGTYLGVPAEGSHSVTKCSIRQSSQRGVVLHLACGITVEDNNFYDVTGHVIFQEDGPERFNKIRRNAIFGPKSPTTENSLLKHEGDVNHRLSVCIWIANPHNWIEDNRCYGGVLEGWSLAFYPGNFGLGVEVLDFHPIALQQLSIKGNISSFNGNGGLDNRSRQVDSRGNINNVSWDTFDSGLTNVGNRLTPTGLIEGCVHIKNRGAGYANTVFGPHYEKFISSGNYYQDFAGGVQGGLEETWSAELCLDVGESLNNANPIPGAKSPFATYHGALAFLRCLLLNWRYTPSANPVDDVGGGPPFALWDYYVNTPELTLKRSHTLLRIACDPGAYRTKDDDNGGQFIRPNGLAGAIWDPHGYNVDTPGHWWIYNKAFYTYGAADLADVYRVEDNNGKSTSTRYAGITEPRINGVDLTLAGHMVIERLQPDGTVIDTIERLNPTGGRFMPFRQFSAIDGGIFKISWLDVTHGASFNCALMALIEPGHRMVLGLPLIGTGTADFNYATLSGNLGNGGARGGALLKTSLAEVAADTTGTAYFHDKPANTLYVCVRGGLVDNTPHLTDSDPDLYRKILLNASTS